MATVKFIVIPVDVSEPIRVEEFDDGPVKGLASRTRYDKAVELIGGGYVQIISVHGYKKLHMCADEDGKVKRLPFNYRATIVASIGGGDSVVGDVVICGKNFNDIEKAAPEFSEVLKKMVGEGA